MPDNGDSPRYIPDRIGDYTGVLTEPARARPATRRSAS